MKELNVKKVNPSINASWEEILKSLENAEWNIIDTINWQKYDYCPQVYFRMAYCDWSFLLHYRVKEQSVRAIAAVDNEAVWKDSCVEFFVMPADDGIYYNFEFNCIGTCLLAAGATRNSREAASNDVMSQIHRKPSLGKNTFNERKQESEWNIALAIPYACLFKHPDFSPAGKTVRANFYKCGDELTVPHYISWNPINVEKPDFHRPEFFGMVTFEK